MHIIILGSGVIGVTNAYYLAKEGHKVTVIDRQSSAGLETSFANAGQISPGYSAPWAAPGVPQKAVKWILSKYAPLIVNFNPEWDKIKFIVRMFSNCTEKAYSINKDRMVRLAEYSRQCLIELDKEIAFDYNHERKGTLQIFRTETQLKSSAKDIAVLKENNVPFELLDADGCVEVEPGLADVKNDIKGGLRLLNDMTGDCFKLTTQLMEKCREMGVEFMFDTSINKLNMSDGKISSVDTSAGDLTADKYIMALGCYSTQLLKEVGIDSPVYPVKGYSLTLPVINEDAAPISTIMDETYKVAVTRLGNRIRVAGVAELTGYDLSIGEKQRDTMRHVIANLFPNGTDLTDDNIWCGLRPMTPDGTPIIGKTDIPNLFLNTGHGTLGWTMSFGSAKVCTDIVCNKEPEIMSDNFSISRYKNPTKRQLAPKGMNNLVSS
ncbi:MAG: D-amino-acid dehydrogenase [Cocleimonas sp.]|jgi:D-amino-acid dehydrogenase